MHWNVRLVYSQEINAKVIKLFDGLNNILRIFIKDKYSFEVQWLIFSRSHRVAHCFGSVWICKCLRFVLLDMALNICKHFLNVISTWNFHKESSNSLKVAQKFNTYFGICMFDWFCQVLCDSSLDSPFQPHSVMSQKWAKC